MKLADLDPFWLGAGGEGITRDGQPVPERHGVALGFNCPCGCGDGLCIPLANPLDGGPAVQSPNWQREGETFEALTLRPSILRRSGCGWHGFITNGEIQTV